MPDSNRRLRSIIPSAPAKRGDPGQKENPLGQSSVVSPIHTDEGETLVRLEGVRGAPRVCGGLVHREQCETDEAFVAHQMGRPHGPR